MNRIFGSFDDVKCGEQLLFFTTALGVARGGVSWYEANTLEEVLIGERLLRGRGRGSWNRDGGRVDEERRLVNTNLQPEERTECCALLVYQTP